MRSYWDEVHARVLLRAEEGPFFAGDGYGAQWEQMGEAVRNGELTIEYGPGGYPFAHITEKGRQELVRLRALGRIVE